jgi:GR25 family glycosyltransferase involved in LPS biosynthesis
LEEHVLSGFERVRIINLVDRPDRRQEMITQLDRLEGTPRNVEFFDAKRPSSAGEFPSIGARGCFESHLAILKEASKASVASLLIIEDDFDFSKSQLGAAARIFSDLMKQQWGFFYGSHLLPRKASRGLAAVAHDQPVQTTAFVAFSGEVIGPLISFLEELSKRPAGTPPPDYGPMHVDGAYSVFRAMHPDYRTFAAFPPLGRQRSSFSDINPTHFYLDRWAATRKIASRLRRARNWISER